MLQTAISVCHIYRSVPKYDYDGRIVQISDATTSAIYNNSAFSFTYGKQDYGVRAIGTADSIDSLGAALDSARSNVATYTVSANNAAQAALEKRGEALFTIVITHASSSTATYGDSDVTTLKALVKDLQKSLDYIDNAYRQAIIGFAAAKAESYDEFSIIKKLISSDETALATLVNDYKEKASLPESFVSDVNKLDAMQNDMRYAANECDKLTGGTYTWAHIRPIMSRIMDSDKVFIGDDKLAQADASAILGSSGEIVVTLAPGSGVPAGIADFAGNYDAWYNLMGKKVNITTKTTQSPIHLAAVSTAMDSLNVEDSDQTSQEPSLLKATYGYAIDLAFRTNATGADLLLQTDAEQRVYQDSTSDATQGGGSYMEFSTLSDTYTVGHLLNLMDAVRVAFVDDANNVLGIARLNISNREVVGDAVKASLYLYEYTVEDDGILTMGERRKTDGKLTDLEKNIAKAVTAVVWLDGDLIDNTMVEADMPISGVLNLQFSTNAVLVPAHNGELYNMQIDREGLKNQIEESETIFSSGKGLNTTESWNRFADSYNYAVAVNGSDTATAFQIANAAQTLRDAEKGLKEVTHEALQEKIKEVREKVGTTDKVARLAYYYDGKAFPKEDSVVPASLPEDIDYYTPAGIIIKNPDEITTEREYKKYTPIYTVDYEKNIRDEGNGIISIIYTEKSWLNLANALYEAEIQELNPKLTNEELDDIITVLDDALKSLVLDKYYKAYHLFGYGIYYYSLKDDDGDTYGQWYDSNFQRVVSDKRILDLDADAVPLEAAEISISDYIDNRVTTLLPYISLDQRLKGYKLNGDEYNGDEIIGAYWSCSDLGLFSFDEKLARLDQLIASAKQQGCTDPALAAAVSARESFKRLSDVDDLDSYITALENALEETPEEGFKVPTGPSSYTVVNRIEAPRTLLHIKGENLNRTIELSAWVLTKNGVIYEATKNVTLYTKAEDIELDENYPNVLTAGDTMQSAGVSLRSFAGKETTETIKSYSWASSNPWVATVLYDGSDKCTITGVSAGSARISVSVETVQGNTYTISYDITVNPAPEPELPEESGENP